ncbi:MAG: cobyrinate a,c-diamide synthase, partial [Selenomonadaceae bacterium]|nr:cobyrinate a,c-diamide synthase [Selenomonadaceae bacterium]
MSKVLVMGAVSSGCGKTTLTIGLIAALRARGLSVQPYKVGPDYIDTSYHALAAGRPSHNLDSWLVPIERLSSCFTSTLDDADMAIVEGVMGFYDGGRRGISSTAEIAKLIGAPVVLVIDAKSIGTSAAAIALGFREYDRSVELAGVILNRVGSDTHRQMIVDALNAIGIKCFGALKRDEQFAIPERHLGLLMAGENPSLDFLPTLRRAVEDQIDIDGLIGAAREVSVPPTVERSTVERRCRIGIARDDAFSFYYPESLNELERLGAELIEFSPLRDERLPTVDGLILGGGYPEMFAVELERNESMRESIKRA